MPEPRIYRSNATSWILQPGAGLYSAYNISAAAWDSRPTDKDDGDYLTVTDTGVVYRWKASISEWVRADVWSYTFTQLGATLGASTTPSGWTKSGTNFSTDGTALTIGTTSPASDVSQLSVVPSAGARIYVSGYYHCTAYAGTTNFYASMATVYDDGTKRRNFGCRGDRTLLAHSDNSTTPTFDSGVSVTTRKWLENYFIPSGRAFAWLAFDNQPTTLFRAYSEGGAPTAAAVAVGDGNTPNGAVSVYENFRVFALT